MKRWPVYHINCAYIAAPNRRAALEAAGVTTQEAREIGVVQVSHVEVNAILTNEDGSKVIERGKPVSLGSLRDKLQQMNSPGESAHDE